MENDKWKIKRLLGSSAAAPPHYQKANSDNDHENGYDGHPVKLHFKVAPLRKILSTI
jgi:hypothetical protein